MIQPRLIVVLCTMWPFGLALAADTPEIEPNETKSAATSTAALISGDTLSGTSTGTSTNPGTASVDYFRVNIASIAGAPQIYRHRLLLTSANAHSATIRGVGQTAAAAAPWLPGMTVGTASSTETSLQSTSTSTTPANFNQWYGFGRTHSIYHRITGSGSTPLPYQWTLETVPIVPAHVGTFLEGELLITTQGQGHSTDTDLWLYDHTLTPIRGAGNDDESAINGGLGTTLQSRLVRTLIPGNYYLALSNFNIANNQGSPSDDDFRTGALTDFADVALNTSTTNALNVAFAITDSAGTTPFAATKGGAYDIVWVQFTVVSRSIGTLRTHFSNIAGSATRDVPGRPGLLFDEGTTGNFLRPNLAVDGLSMIAMVAEADDATLGSVDVFLRGHINPFSVTAFKVAGDSFSGATYESFRTDAAILSNFQTVFGANLSGDTATDEVVLSTDSFNSVSVEAREGSAIYTSGFTAGTSLAPGGFGQLTSDASGRSSGVNGDANKQILFRSGTVIAETDVTIPPGQLVLPTQTLDVIAEDRFHSVYTTGSIWKGDLNGPTGTDDIMVVNNSVVAQQGAMLPGSAFTSPVSGFTNDTGSQRLSPGGEFWIFRGANADGMDWVVESGDVIARTDSPIVPGSTELYDDATFAQTFFANTVSDMGHVVVGGVTNNPDTTRNAVLVFYDLPGNAGGSRVVLREGDPVDLNGNGLLDDGLYIGTFNNDNVALDTTCTLWFSAGLRNAAGTAVGQAFMSLQIPTTPVPPGLVGLKGGTNAPLYFWDGSEWTIPFTLPTGSSLLTADPATCTLYYTAGGNLVSKEPGVEPVIIAPLSVAALGWHEGELYALARPPGQTTGDFDALYTVDLVTAELTHVATITDLFTVYGMESFNGNLYAFGRLNSSGFDQGVLLINTTAPSATLLPGSAATRGGGIGGFAIDSGGIAYLMPSDAEEACGRYDIVNQRVLPPIRPAFPTASSGGTSSAAAAFAPCLAAVPPGNFTLTSPANGSGGVSVTTMLDWTDAAGAVAYHVQIDDTPDFSSTVLYTVTATSSLAVPPGTLQTDRVYHWRVFAQTGPRLTPSTPASASFATGAPTPTCAADFNNSGVLSVQDIFDFLAAYFAGCP